MLVPVQVVANVPRSGPERSRIAAFVGDVANPPWAITVQVIKLASTKRLCNNDSKETLLRSMVAKDEQVKRLTGGGFDRDAPLFNFRFGLRSLLLTTAFVATILTLVERLPNYPRLVAYALLALVLGFAALSIRVLINVEVNKPSLGRLALLFIGISVVIWLGPIASYHINGRAWYDYGWSGWNPPPYQYLDGTREVVDYDPKNTPPGTWPIVGNVMMLLCLVSMFVLYLPPLAPGVAIILLAIAIRARDSLNYRQKVGIALIWLGGAIPIIYMYVWGGKVFEWFFD